MTEDPIKRLRESVRRQRTFLDAIRKVAEEIRKEREQETEQATATITEQPEEQPEIGG